MSEQETLYTIALTRALPMNYAAQNLLMDTLGSATAVFDARHHLLDAVPDATPRLTQAVSLMDQHLARAEEELSFAQQGNIQCIGRHEEAFPYRLRECDDAPLLLYYYGNGDLNRRHIVSMVGTRHCTEYGKQLCERFVRDLKEWLPDTLIVSGLAYGIDINSHRQALAYGLDTVGVLAHGLDQIYPRLHRATAVEMTQHGGLLTEYMSHSTPEKLNFVSRNRIVAGLADATIVVESKAKGGSLITAELAQDYHRDVFAFPGRIGDEASEGCNRIIHSNRAAILLSAEDFVQAMGWENDANQPKVLQTELFAPTTPEEQAIVDALADGNPHDLNQLTTATGMSTQKITTLLFDLELRGVIQSANGCRYLLAR
ncbi:MAG: DNA-protecting protein DprA [Bacteroidaceae bacterium]|nr:DNA-protecting protein DprA [Bacteroidaceae bacterium]